jgi:hypothetical protein
MSWDLPILYSYWKSKWYNHRLQLYRKVTGGIMPRFVKGISGNPRGGAIHDQTKRQIKKLTTLECEMVLNDLLLAHPDDFQKITKEDSTILKNLMASVIATAMKKGDASVLFALLDRLIGKVTDKVKVDSVVENKPSVVVYVPANGREAPDAN